MKITTKEDIIQELEGIQTQLDQEVKDENQIAEYGDEIAVYMSRTSVLLADCKYHRDKSVKEFIYANLEVTKSMPPSTLNKLIDSATEEESRMYLWCERLNRAATHRLDWCRTRLSFLKEQMKAY